MVSLGVDLEIIFFKRRVWWGYLYFRWTDHAMSGNKGGKGCVTDDPSVKGSSGCVTVYVKGDIYK